MLHFKPLSYSSHPAQACACATAAVSRLFPHVFPASDIYFCTPVCWTHSASTVPSGHIPLPRTPEIRSGCSGAAFIREYKLLRLKPFKKGAIFKVYLHSMCHQRNTGPWRCSERSSHQHRSQSQS